MFAEIVFMVVGFVCLGWAGYSTAQRLLYSSWQSYRFEQSLQGEEPAIRGYIGYLREGSKVAPHAEGEDPAVDLAARASEAAQARKLAHNELIGRIEIPRVKVSAVVKEGVDTKTLEPCCGSRALHGVTRRKRECRSGGSSGHIFPRLEERPAGRRGPPGDTRWSLSVQSQHDEDRLAEKCRSAGSYGRSTLTLVTCYPFNYIGSAPKRFIVQAKQVGFEELAARGKTQSSQQLLTFRGKQEAEQLFGAFRVAAPVRNGGGLDDRWCHSAGIKTARLFP